MAGGRRSAPATSGDRVAPHPPRLRKYAVELGAAQRLPFLTRSLTEAEAMAKRRLFARVLGGGGALVLLAMGILAFDPGDPEMVLVAVLAVLAAAAMLWMMRHYEKRGRSYVDPRIQLEFRESWLTVRHPGEMFDMRYADADLAFHYTYLRNAPNFIGAVLATPIGKLRLDDDHFRQGRLAAAILAHRCDQAGLFRGLPES